ncbi:MAG: hypothetical protein ACYDCK_01385 [Thermoplasmatota archaeon]
MSPRGGYQPDGPIVANASPPSGPSGVPKRPADVLRSSLATHMQLPETSTQIRKQDLIAIHVGLTRIRALLEGLGADPEAWLQYDAQPVRATHVGAQRRAHHDAIALLIAAIDDAGRDLAHRSNSKQPEGR